MPGAIAVACRGARCGHEQPFRHGFARTLKRQLQTETRRPFTNDEHSGVGLSWRSPICRCAAVALRFTDIRKGVPAKVGPR